MKPAPLGKLTPFGAQAIRDPDARVFCRDGVVRAFRAVAGSDGRFVRVHCAFRAGICGFGNRAREAWVAQAGCNGGGARALRGRVRWARLARRRLVRVLVKVLLARRARRLEGIVKSTFLVRTGSGAFARHRVGPRPLR